MIKKRLLKTQKQLLFAEGDGYLRQVKALF